MFSGLTNQVSSWMGSVKGETEEKVPTPTDENNTLLNPEVKEGISPTKNIGSGRLEMFSNVKNQIEGFGGWIGSSIPKLRKGEHESGTSNIIGHENPAAETELPPTGDPVKDHRDDDDNSRNFSATGGADSGPQSLAESPTEENGGQFGNVQSKALAGAKSFGSFLYSAVNKAGKTVTEAGSKIHALNNILGEFNKEQEAFMKGKGSSSATALPPWTGCANEESLKEECLSLSTDKRNFVRSPPTGVDFQFDYDISYPIAMAIMEQDPNLEKMRYDLVPKIISEEEFWKNYFYRVSLICQANELSFMSRDGDNQAGTVTSAQHIDSKEKEHEFVSDTFIANKEDIHEVQEGMKKLALGAKHINEEDWEKELEAELQDYELVGDTKDNNLDHKEIDDMLGVETDLK